MAERTPPEFRFDADDQQPDEFYREEMKDMRVEKLSQRMTLVTILLPCLIAVAFYFGYRALTNRIHLEKTSENLELQNLSDQMEAFSEQLNEKLVSFSETLSAMDQDFDNSVSARLNTFNEQIAKLNDSQSSLNEKLEQTKNDMEKLKGDLGKLGDSQVKIKGQEADIARISTDLRTLKKELQALTEIRSGVKTVAAEIKQLENRFAVELESIAARADRSNQDYDQFQESISQQLAEKSDKTVVGLELLRLKKNQDNHTREIAELSRKLDSILKQLDSMQPMSGLNQQSMEASPPKAPVAESTLTGNTGSDDRTIPSGSEEIRLKEQDLPPE